MTGAAEVRRPAPFALYLIADASSCADVVARTEAALAAIAGHLRGSQGPAVGVQLRAKGLPARALLPLARRLRAVTAGAGVPLLLNERLDVARVVGADGVQLPEETFTPAEARAALGPAALVGASCHDARGLAEAAMRGADFATLAPFAATPGKGPPLGRDGFAELSSRAALPVLALGGLGAATVGDALAAGADGVAVIGAVYRADDPGAAAVALIRALQAAGGPAWAPLDDATGAHATGPQATGADATGDDLSASYGLDAAGRAAR